MSSTAAAAFTDALIGAAEVNLALVHPAAAAEFAQAQAQSRTKKDGTTHADPPPPAVQLADDGGHLCSALLTRVYCGETHRVLLQSLVDASPVGASSVHPQHRPRRLFEYWLQPAEAQLKVAPPKRDRRERVTFQERFEELTGVAWTAALESTRQQRQRQADTAAAHPTTTGGDNMFRWELAPLQPPPVQAQEPKEVSVAVAGVSVAGSSPALPPAFSFPKSFSGFDTPFHSYDVDDGGETGGPGTRAPLFLCEIDLARMGAQLREKPDWATKVQNPLIRFKWLCEMRAQAPNLSPKATASMLQEIEYWARQQVDCRRAGRPCHMPTAVTGVWQSDDTVDEELRRKLLQAMKPLEDVPEEKKDYHPNSHRQVVNLVHPSMYCYRLGKSSVVDAPFTLADTFRHVGSIEQSTPREVEPKMGFSGEYTFSENFAWLPSEFRVDSEGRVTIESYVNNLHPTRHADLYPLLAQAFECCLPLLERVLTDLVYVPEPRQENSYEYTSLPAVDRVEERLAWRAWNRAEREARRQARAIESEVAAAASTSTPADESALESSLPACLLALAHESMSESQRSCSYRVLRQVHPDTGITVHAMALLGKLQDGIAHLMLVENFRSAAVESAAQQPTTNVDAAAAVADGAPSEAGSSSAPPAAVAVLVDPLVVGLQPRFPPRMHAEMGELLKHSLSESMKAVTKYRAAQCANDDKPPRSMAAAAGLVFESGLAKRWWGRYRRSLKRTATIGTTAHERAAAQAILARLPRSLSNVAQVSLCAQLEYFTAELLELGGNACRDHRLSSIQPRHLQLAYSYDVELDALCAPIMVASDQADATRAEQLVRDELRKEAEEEAKAAASTTTTSRKRDDEDELLPVTYGGLAAAEVQRADKNFKPSKKQVAGEEEEGEEGEKEGAGAGATGNADGAEEEEEDEDDDDGEYSRGPLQHGDVTFPFPCPPPFDQLPPEKRISLKGRRLQVIVKLATIVLSPTDAKGGKYGGGSWHVEGMENECIVASAIVYLDEVNLTESRLAFRQACDMQEPEQDDSRSGRELYGIDRDDAANQVLGSVHTKAGRAIAFPNLFQHQVQPFQLDDKTKAGHRKILVFFLCDPTKRIVSTATVPPQQRDWCREYLASVRLPLVMAHTPLIVDLAKLVLEYDGVEESTIDHQQAMADRLELMAERSAFVADNTEQMFSRPFSFCEH